MTATTRLAPSPPPPTSTAGTTTWAGRASTARLRRRARRGSTGARPIRRSPSVRNLTPAPPCRARAAQRRTLARQGRGRRVGRGRRRARLGRRARPLHPDALTDPPGPPAAMLRASFGGAALGRDWSRGPMRRLARPIGARVRRGRVARRPMSRSHAFFSARGRPHDRARGRRLGPAGHADLGRAEDAPAKRSAAAARAASRARTSCTRSCSWRSTPPPASGSSCWPARRCWAVRPIRRPPRSRRRPRPREPALDPDRHADRGRRGGRSRGRREGRAAKKAAAAAVAAERKARTAFGRERTSAQRTHSKQGRRRARPRRARRPRRRRNRKTRRPPRPPARDPRSDVRRAHAARRRTTRRPRRSGAASVSSASAEPASAACPRLDGLPGRELAGGLRVVEAHTRASRMKGLAKLDELPETLALHIPRCRSVHTFTMRFPLDLIWLDKARRGRPDRPERPAAPAEVLPARALGDRGQRRHRGSLRRRRARSQSRRPTPRLGPGTHAEARAQG